MAATLLAHACDSKPPAPQAAPDTGTKTSTSASLRGKPLPEVNWPDGPVARVNGVDIPRKQFDIYYNRFRTSMHKNPILLPVGGPEAVMSRVVKRLVAEEIIRQQAKAQNIKPPEDLVKGRMDEVHDRLKRDPLYAEMHRELGTTEETWLAEAEVDALREALVQKALKEYRDVPEALIKQEYESRIKEWKHPEQIRVARIRFDFGQGMTGDQIKELRKRAEAVRESIRKGLSFERAAKEFSSGSSGHKGGDLGWLARQTLSENVADALWKLKPNTISEVLEDDRGIYIFKVLGFRKEGTAPLEDVRAMLLMDLKKRRQEEALNKLLDDWRAGAKIEILIPELSEAMTRTATVMPAIPEPDKTGMQLPTHH